MIMVAEASPEQSGAEPAPVRDWRYPEGSVRAVLESDLLTQPTAAALRERLVGPRAAAPELLTSAAMATLEATCERLIPQADRPERIDVAGELHRRLVDGSGDGWRYADMPPDEVALPLGLRGIDETARLLFGDGFAALFDIDRDAVLRRIQFGSAPGEVWRAMKAERFFEELLAQIADIYFAHPLAQEEIGYLGMADARGWAEVGLGARAPYEPEGRPEGQRVR